MESHSVKVIVSCLLALAVLAGCGAGVNSNNDSNSQTSQNQPLTNPARPALPTSQFSDDLSEMFAGLIQETIIHPDKNAVRTFAEAVDWKPVPQGMNSLLGAQVGYVGRLDGRTVMLGTDGTNDIVSVAVSEGFEVEELKSRLSQFLSLQEIGSDSSLGQTMEIYRVADNSTLLGVLSFTYGTVEAIQGAGSVSFMSVAKAQAEGIRI